MTKHQVDLGDFVGESGSRSKSSGDALEFHHSVEGYIGYFSWYRGTPSLSFINSDATLNCDGLEGESLHVILHEERVCANCGEKLSNPKHSVCYKCSQRPPFTQCIKTPGTDCTNADCPFPDYKRDACAHTYVVYLVTKDNVKVGISRSDRRLQRWAEQGASHAIVVAETPNRKSAGLIEEALSDRFETRSSSSWYDPRTSPVEDLVGAARTVPEYIPADSRLHACLTLNDLDEAVVADRVVSIPHRATGVDHAHGETRPELAVGDSGEGTILGVRGNVILTDSFALNLKKRQGYRATIETTAELAVEAGDEI